MIYYIIFGMIILFIIYLNIKTTRKDDIFLTKEETIKFIEKDNDFYIQLLSIADLHARGEETHNGYKIKSMKDITNFNKKEYIRKCCIKADEWFKDRKLKYIGENHDIDKIKWVIGCMKGYYENGLPHTRGNIVFLPLNIENKVEKDIIKTLIHEKVHIYCRKNREKILDILRNNGYRRKKHRSKERLIRGNPDIDEFIYEDKYGTEMKFVYNSEEPKSIMDGKITGEYEHPLEMISYEIENEYLF
jgi:hypothetical protein